VPTCVGGPGVWEAPVFTERTSVGLDVHARSVVAAAIDGVTGEVFRARLTPGNEEVIDWVRALPGPSAAVYEAGPTGFGLSRAFTTAGIRCEIAAPSKIQLELGITTVKFFPTGGPGRDLRWGCRDRCARSPVRRRPVRAHRRGGTQEPGRVPGHPRGRGRRWLVDGPSRPCQGRRFHRYPAADGRCRCPRSRQQLTCAPRIPPH
jgi:hypothetical protein